MHLNTCLVVLLVAVAAQLPCAWTMNVTVTEYFPEVNRDLTKITWAHAVNSHELLLKTLADHKINMIEADVLMGSVEGFSDERPIMAHTKGDHSDLTLIQFLTAVIGAIQTEGRRVGIKLDFKEINAVEPTLKYLRTRLDSGDTPNFPVIVNADILQGPVNSTRKPVDAKLFIEHAIKYTPFAMLSVGWTTRYGKDDPENEILEGAYTKEHAKEMYNTLRKYAGSYPVFSQITFPVRAGLAIHSIDPLTGYLIPRIRSSLVSLTLWSPKTDVVDKDKLQRLIDVTTSHRCFIDLPPSILGEEEEKANSRASEPSEDKHHQAHHVQEPSQIGQLESRGHSELEHRHSHDTPLAVSKAGRHLNFKNIFPVVAAGVVAAFLFNRR